jgi:hypothetical protein
MAENPEGNPDQDINEYPEHHGLISVLNRVAAAIIS